MDSYGEVWIHLLPFVRPATVRHGLEGEKGVDEIRTYQEAVQAAVAHMEIDKRYRDVYKRQVYHSGDRIFGQAI